ncbi:MAG: hypothetical protein ACLUR5_07730 [Eubacterium ventriosum]
MGSQPLYQENDIMLATSFLKNVAIKQKKPIVIVVGLGCGNGGRAGGSPLDEVLSRIGSKIGNCVVSGDQEMKAMKDFIIEVQ